MNPRRPTPSGFLPPSRGPKPDPLIQSLCSLLESDGRSSQYSPPIHQLMKRNTGAKLVWTLEMHRMFLQWIVGENPDIGRKQLRSYELRSLELIDKDLYRVLGEWARKSKNRYETASRIITFLKKKLKLREEGEELRELIGKKPKTRKDTYVPPIELVVAAGQKLKHTDVYPLYLLLVSTGSRLSSIIYALKHFDPDKLVCLDTDPPICRYHVDYEKGTKNQWTLYMPKEIADIIKNINTVRIPRYNKAEEKINKAGVSVKYYRKFVYNYMRKQRVDPDIAEFIEGRVPQNIGYQHYLEKIMQADEQYPAYAKWLMENILSKL